MKIQNKGYVQLIFEGKLRQPFPISKSQITLDGRSVDIAIANSEVAYNIDGKDYSGLLMYLLFENRG